MKKTPHITIEFADHWFIAVALPNGDINAAQFSPYTIWGTTGPTAEEVLAECREALRTYQDLPKNLLN